MLSASKVVSHTGHGEQQPVVRDGNNKEDSK